MAILSKTTKACTIGFEPTRAKHNGLAVHPRNHLGTHTVNGISQFLKFWNALSPTRTENPGRIGYRTQDLPHAKRTLYH